MASVGGIIPSRLHLPKIDRVCLLSALGEQVKFVSQQGHRKAWQRSLRCATFLHLENYSSFHSGNSRRPRFPNQLEAARRLCAKSVSSGCLRVRPCLDLHVNRRTGVGLSPLAVKRCAKIRLRFPVPRRATKRERLQGLTLALEFIYTISPWTRRPARILSLVMGCSRTLTPQAL
jgi:hypothetical protein